MNILVAGAFPPPFGGVNVFIQRLFSAVKTKGTASIKLFSWVDCFRSRDAVLHVNSSRPAKRLVLVLAGFIFFRAVYFTVHGGKFSLANPFNRIASLLSSGVFCLNRAIEAKLTRAGIRHLRHSTIFQENRDDIRSLFVRRRDGVKRILFYANNSRSIDGKEIYGAEFFGRLVPAIIERLDCEIFVVDLSGSFASLFKNTPGVIYCDEPVNFLSVLAETDVYVRPTSTDGMSVALLEAGILGVPCLASDAAERPSFVQTFRLLDDDDFMGKLAELLSNGVVEEEVVNHSLSSVDEILQFMVTDLSSSSALS